jgi:RHS repeat-associated protein
MSQTTTFGHDANNNRTRISDANDHVTTFAYDERNRLKSKTYPDGDSWRWAHDGDNNRIRSTAPNGRVTETTYDALNRPTQTIYAGAPAGEVQSTAYTYDGNSNVRTISETSSAGTRTEARDYDDFDRLTEVTDGDGRTLRYAYDDVGNRTRLTDADGHDAVWTYNDLNQNTRVTVPGMGTTSLGYAPSGRVTEISRPDGSLTEQTYFDNGRLQSIRHGKAGQTLARYDYVYDPNGNRTEQRELNGATTGDTTQRTRYVYDEAGRLVEVQEPDRTTTYTLDAVGNRIAERVVDGNGTVISDSALVYNDRDQLTSRSDPVAQVQVQQTWDTNGNLATQTVNSQSPRIYTYDARDRLVGLTLPNSPSGPATLRFAYHADGLRREKTDGITTTRYQYDGQSLLAETNAIGNTLRQFHYSAMQMIAQTQAGTTPVHRHVLLDALRSPIALLDPTGVVTARTSYDAFGEIRAQLGTNGTLTAPDRNRANAELASTDGQPIGFTGYLKDAESGLYYAKARYYDPVTARFTAEDPEAGKDLEPPSLHRYLYAYANPTAYVDPTGRQSVDSPQYALQQMLNMAATPRQREMIKAAIARYEAERPDLAEASIKGATFGGLVAIPGAAYVRAVYGVSRAAYATYTTYGATAAVFEHGAAATTLVGIGAEASYGFTTGAASPSAVPILPIGPSAAEARSTAWTTKIPNAPPAFAIAPARPDNAGPLARASQSPSVPLTVSEGASGNPAIAIPWKAPTETSGLSFQELRALRVAGLSREEITRNLEINGDIYLFRGTSPGWKGTPGAQASAASASIDPYKATVFALEAKAQAGQAVVQYGKRSEIGSFGRGNWFAAQEREVGMAVSASRFATKAPNSIPVEISRKILSDMGMPPLPVHLRSKDDRRDLLSAAPNMTPEQIADYLQRAKAGE